MRASPPDFRAWLARWDAQQELHIPHREDRFHAITDALAAAVGPAPSVLDLGCGPGSLSVRVLQRLPDAQVVAIDSDPVLLAIGQGALGDDRRICFIDADLREDWVGRLPDQRRFGRGGLDHGAPLADAAAARLPVSEAGPAAEAGRRPAQRRPAGLRAG